MSSAAAHPDQPADSGPGREATLERLHQHLGDEGFARLEEFLAAIRRGEHPDPEQYGFSDAQANLDAELRRRGLK